MKKKILTTAFVCALSAACIFGATACNKDSGSGNSADAPSEQVTEEQWKAAIVKTREATNFTVKSSYEDSTLCTHKAPADVEEYGNPSSGHYVDQTFSVMENKLSSAYNYKYESKSKKAGDVCEEDERATYGEKIDGKWYSTLNNISDIDGEWGSVGSSEFLASFISPLGYFSDYPQYRVSFDDRNGVSLENAYSQFTYKDGVYKAKFYDYFDSDSSHHGTTYEEWVYETEYELEIKINKDGYVSYYKYINDKVFDGERAINTYTRITMFIFSNFGTTSVQSNSEAKQAIDKYIEEHNA